MLLIVFSSRIPHYFFFVCFFILQIEQHFEIILQLLQVPDYSNFKCMGFSPFVIVYTLTYFPPGDSRVLSIQWTQHTSYLWIHKNWELFSLIIKKDTEFGVPGSGTSKLLFFRNETVSCAAFFCLD